MIQKYYANNSANVLLYCPSHPEEMDTDGKQEVQATREGMVLWAKDGGHFSSPV